MRVSKRIVVAAVLGVTFHTACEPGGSSRVSFEVTEASLTELQTAMTEGRVTSAQLVDAYLDRIAAYDQAGPALNAIIRVHPDARGQAERLDAERAAGTIRGPLHGVPILLKDNYDTFDMPTTGSTIALAGSVPPDDAFQVARLREAGAVILAKTNLHELAAGITSISSLGGQTRNPYAPLRNPGGSSGGTGAGVAASFGAVGWGSDTCGSIRIPASVHNLVGLRPTKGLSSIDGIIPLSHTQDTGGPLARSVTDLAIALDATVGPDEADPATRALRGLALPRFVDSLDPNALAGARIGVLDAWMGESPAEQPVTDVVRSALEEMTRAGAEVVPLEIPDLDSLLARTSLIGLEFQPDFREYLEATPGAPIDDLIEIVEMGLHHEQMEVTFRARASEEGRARAADDGLLETWRARQVALRDALIALLDQHDLDAIAYPSLRQEPQLIGDAPLGMSLVGFEMSGCFLAAQSGLPAISAPAGFTTRALPVGIELMGRPFADARLVSLAYALEQATSPRRAPYRTPALIDGRAPAPRRFSIGGSRDGEAPGATPELLDADLVLDVPAGTLGYSIEVTGAPAGDVHAIVLQRRDSETPEAIVRRLSGPGRLSAAGTLELTSVMLSDLLEGRLELALYTATHPLGSVRIGLTALGPR